MKVWKTEVRRSVCSIGFLGAAAGIFLAGAAGCMGFVMNIREPYFSGLYQGSVFFLTAWGDGISGEALLMVIPVTGALPYAASFMEEWSSRFYIFYAARVSRKRYVDARLGSVFLSGGGAVFLALLALLAVLRGILPWDSIQEAALREVPLSQVLYLLGMEIMRLTLNGSFWALTGNLAAVLGKHVYLTWVAPLCLYYILDTFQKRYFSKYYLLSPKQWMTGAALGPGEAVLWMAALNAVILAVSRSVMEGRLFDG